MIEKDILVGDSLVQEVYKRPEKISEVELGDLLAALGNHEAKALSLILMSGGNLFTMYSLQQRFLSSQGENPVWKISFSLPFNYCRDSLSPIGLVTQETIDENLKTYGYQITEKGERLGVPFAGLILDFSLRYNISLQDLFGFTHSRSGRPLVDESERYQADSKVRSPLLAFTIFYELATNPNLMISEVDIVKNSDLMTHSNASKHLFKLSQNGIISYKSVGQGKPRRYYSFDLRRINETPTQYPQNRSLTPKLFSVIKSDPERVWTVEDVTKKLVIMFPEYYSNVRIYLLQEVSEMLYYLGTQDFLRVEKVDSEITMNEKQRQVIADLVTTLDSFMSGDPKVFERGRSLAFQIVSDPESVRRLLNLSREHSPFASSKTSSERLEQIFSLVTGKPGQSTKEIYKILKVNGERIGAESVRMYLSKLMKNGLVTFRTMKQVYHWYPLKLDN